MSENVYCNECGNKLNFFNRIDVNNKTLCNKCNKKLYKKISKEYINSCAGKYTNDSIVSQTAVIDKKNKLIIWCKDKLTYGKYNFSDVASFTPIDKGHGEIKKHGITRSLVGATLAGPLGAIVGAVTGGKNFEFIDQLSIDITFNDNNHVLMEFIKQPNKAKRLKNELESFAEACSILDKITSERENNAITTDNGINDLKKLKELADNGIITQEEFEAKKKQILGL